MKYNKVAKGLVEIPNTPILLMDDDPDNSYPNIATDIYELWKGKRVCVIGVQGAFAPGDNAMLNQYEEEFERVVLGDESFKFCDEIYCHSVNDVFVMREWFAKNNIKKVKLLPDGNGFLSTHLGTLVDMHKGAMAWRNRRYAAIIEDNKIEKMFVEPEPSRGNPDPYHFTKPTFIHDYLVNKQLEKQKTGEINER